MADCRKRQMTKFLLSKCFIEVRVYQYLYSLCNLKFQEFLDKQFLYQVLGINYKYIILSTDAYILPFIIELQPAYIESVAQQWSVLIFNQSEAAIARALTNWNMCIHLNTFTIANGKLHLYNNIGTKQSSLQ